MKKLIVIDARMINASGIGTFIGFWILLLYRVFKKRNNTGLSKSFFLGIVFTLIVVNSIAPVYSLFIWVFPALAAKSTNEVYV